MILKTYRTVLLASVAMILPIVPAAGQPAAPLDQQILKKGKTTNFLNSRLSSLLDSCLGGDANMKKKAKDKLVAVPKRLQTFVEDRNWLDYWRYGNSNVSSFFGYVFSINEIQGTKFKDATEDYLATDFNQPLQNILQVNVSGDQYFEQNCQAAFSAAVSGGGGVKSLFEAAGRAAVNGQRQSRSEIAVGTFLSPFDPTTLFGGDNRDQQFMLYLSYWDWRSRVGDERGFLYKDLSGIAIRNYTTTENGFSARGSASGGISVPFLSFNAKAKGSVEGRQTFSENSSVFVFTKRPSQILTDYFEIPKIADINSAIRDNANATVKIVGGDSILDIGTASEIEMTVPWLTRKHCQGNNDYTVEDAAGGSVSLQYVGQKSTGLGCEFRLSFVPNDMAIAAGRGTLSFKLKRTTGFAGVGIDGFEIPAPDIPFILNNPFKIEVPNQAIELTNNDLGNGIFQYQWKLNPVINTNDGFAISTVRAVDVAFDEACVLNEINVKPQIQSELLTLTQTQDKVTLRWTIGLVANYQKLNANSENKANPVCFLKGSFLIDSGADSYRIPIKSYDAILIVPDVPAA